MLVVVDSSAFGKDPMLDLNQLERWASACERNGHELVVPEVVILELYEHYQARHREFVNNLSQYNKARARHRLELVPEPELIAAEALVTKVGAAGIRTLPITGEDAIESIRDQVLQRGAASKKAGQKVGAADSAWLRSAFAEAGHGDLLIISGDGGAVEGAASQLGIETPPRVPHFPDLGRAIGITPASPEKITEIQCALGDVVERQNEKLAHDLLSRLTDAPMLPFDLTVEVDEIDLLGDPFILEGNFADGSAELTGTLTLAFDDSMRSGVPWDQWKDRHQFAVTAEFSFDLDGEPFFDNLTFGGLVWR